MYAGQCNAITNHQANNPCYADCNGVGMNDTKTCELLSTTYADNICSDHGFPNVEDKIEEKLNQSEFRYQIPFFEALKSLEYIFNEMIFDELFFNYVSRILPCRKFFGLGLGWQVRRWHFT